jgi:hypothetical protein
MPQSTEVRFTKGESRCANCHGAIRWEVSESSPRFLKDADVPCSRCSRDCQLEVIEDGSGFRVRMKAFTDRR